MKSLETQLAEMHRENRELRQKLGKQEIKEKLAQSGLPSFAQERLCKHLELTESVSPKQLETAIAEEKEFLRKIRAANRSVESEESTARKLEIAEAYRASGLSEKEANLAAGLEIAVEQMNESERGLFNAAKAIGMSDAEAKIFAEGRGRF